MCTAQITITRCFPLSLLCLSLIHAQAPDTAWTRAYGTSKADWGYSVQQTSDMGYAITGHQYGSICLIKTNSVGGVIWDKTYPYATSYGYSVQQTVDGGYIVGGQFMEDAYPYRYGILLLKTDSLGVISWTMFYGEGSIGEGRSVQQTSDGGYIVTGLCAHTRQDWDVLLLKLNADGDTLWTKAYGGDEDDSGYALQITSDGGYVIAARTLSFGAGQLDFYLLKTDSLGDTLWTKTYGTEYNNQAYSVAQTSDCGYIIVGRSYFSGTRGYRPYVVRTDSLGIALWTRDYDGKYATEIHQTHDSGYVFAGSKRNPITMRYDIHLVRLDTDGDTVWTTAYGTDEDDFGESMQPTYDGGYVIAGETGSNTGDIYLVKTKVDLISIDEEYSVDFSSEEIATTIISGPLRLPEGKNCRIFDITGKAVAPDKLRPGIYFIEVNGTIAQKVIKVR